MSFLNFLLRFMFLGLFGALWLLAGIYLYLSPDLPDVQTLRDVKLQTPMRVYTREGDLIGQFGEQKRSPLAYDQIPPQFIDALLAAEDDNFFQHQGIDLMGLARAASELVVTGEKGSGGSTLTMQVARNYFLSLEKTFMRKFNEILLAIEIERRLSKQEILELYINRVFLGHRAYGFEAASQVYYGTSIDNLNLAQYAMLAGIPKAPSRNNPISGPEAGKERRNWILGRMRDLGYITQQEYAEAVVAPVTAGLHGAQISFAAHYAAEMARQEMLDRYGVEAYNDGYSVYTTINSPLQKVARQSLIDGLLAYDSRHGYRGPEQHWSPPADDANAAAEYWVEKLEAIPQIIGQTPAVVMEIGEDRVKLLFRDAGTGELLWDKGMSGARPYRTENYLGAAPKTPAELFKPGDLIRVVQDEEGAWQLAQIPAVQGALVSLNPDNGAIVSVVGGMGFELSKFNRATQALRQPGSNFKPFLYSAALEAGFTAASIINDAPIVVADNSIEDIWRPENDSGEFYGPTRLRWALTKSRNVVSIRLLQQLGIDNLVAALERYGIDTSNLDANLSLALGTHAMTPLEVVSGYATIANGGYRVEPYLIDRVEDMEGRVIFQARPPTVCRDCDDKPAPAGRKELSMEEILASEAAEDALPQPPRVMDERVSFIMTSILQDVIKKGTGTRALALKRGDIAGKTGTTNGPMDAWFSGYNRDVVTTTWVGFDNYTPLGRREFGGTAALPIWIDYMREALRDSPDRQRPIPPGVVTVRINSTTGGLAAPGDSTAIFEFFREETAPRATANGQNGNGRSQQQEDNLVRDIF
ncbi:penicillin-binding protein 1A [Haliea sp. E17]|uniref:penicillin-binding protein 1A n=1 Tax=Haliea sp. E17 TaxID=3401576 RepID=UPI003AAF3734